MSTVYKMTVTSGGGTETDGGDFEIVETPKTITFNCVREPFFSNRMSQSRRHRDVPELRVMTPLKINKYYSKKYGGKPAWRITTGATGDCLSYMNNGHVAQFWDDGSVTVYPDQCGIPHYFEKI